MNIIKQYFEIVQLPEEPLKVIESAGRTCYKSEDKIEDGSDIEFTKKLRNWKHESVFEHVSISIRFITNRGVTHELVRHRLCAFSQESTRYVNYGGNEMAFILPVWWEEWTDEQKRVWKSSMENAENAYNDLIESGAEPQQAREVLPNSLKTEIVVTANLRQWRHMFEMRCHSRAHPQIRSLMQACCNELKQRIPVVFEDITYEN